MKRKACSKAKVDVEWFEEMKEGFLLHVKNIVAMDEVPAELVINFDQTALNYVPVTPWTMEEQEAKGLRWWLRMTNGGLLLFLLGQFLATSINL